MSRISSRFVLMIAGVGVIALAVLVSSGCSSGGSAGTDADDSKALEGKVWKATEIAGVTTVLTAKGTEVTAAFAAGDFPVPVA